MKTPSQPIKIQHNLFQSQKFTTYKQPPSFENEKKMYPILHHTLKCIVEILKKI